MSVIRKSEKTGELTCRIEGIQAAVTFAIRRISEAIPADLYGYANASREAKLVRDGGHVRTVLSNATYYTILK